MTKQIRVTEDEWAAMKAAPARITELEKQLADERAKNAALITKAAEPEPVESLETIAKAVAQLEPGIVKAAEDRVIAKRHALEAYVGEVAEKTFTDTTQASVALFKRNDEKYLALAGELREAQREYDMAPERLIETAYAPVVKRLQADLAKQAETHALAHNMPVTDAAVFLSRNSSAYQTTHDALAETLRTMGDAAATLAQKRNGMTAADVYKAAQKDREAQIAAEPVSLKKFNWRLGAFAQSIGKSEAAATEAFVNTPEGAELYAAVRAEQMKAVR